MLFTYNLGKNIKLKIERGIGFETVVEQIENGNYQVAKIKSSKHLGQCCYIIKAKKKVWIVPFKEYKSKIHLFTIFKRD